MAKWLQIFMKVFFHGGRLALIFAPAWLAWGDVVYLKNGRTLEGVVTENNAERVVVNVGLGSMTLSPASVDRVEKDTAGQRRELEGAWEEKFFIHPQYVPAGMESLAEKFRRLTRARSEAVAAQARLHEIRDRQRALAEEIERYEAEYLEVARHLKTIVPGRDPKAYNEAVLHSNRAGSQLTLAHEEYKKLPLEQEKQQQAISDYLAQLEQFKRDRKSQAAGPAAGDPAQRFLARLDKELAGYENEVQAVELPFNRREGHIMVSATINGLANAQLILDTGASLVMLNEIIARRAGINLQKGDQITVTLANGAETDGLLVMLESLAVGDAATDMVPAVVLPINNPGMGDGLLGMSFLREFAVQLDPAGKKAVLKKLRF